MYSAFLVWLTTQSAFNTTCCIHSFTHKARLYSYVLPTTVTHIHTQMDVSVGNVGFSALPKDALTSDPGKPESNLPIGGRLLFLLSYSHPTLWGQLSVMCRHNTGSLFELCFLCLNESYVRLNWLNK